MTTLNPNPQVPTISPIAWQWRGIVPCVTLIEPDMGWETDTLWTPIYNPTDLAKAYLTKGH